MPARLTILFLIGVFSISTAVFSREAGIRGALGNKSTQTVPVQTNTAPATPKQKTTPIKSKRLQQSTVMITHAAFFPALATPGDKVKLKVTVKNTGQTATPVFSIKAKRTGKILFQAVKVDAFPWKLSLRPRAQASHDFSLQLPKRLGRICYNIVLSPQGNQSKRRMKPTAPRQVCMTTKIKLVQVRASTQISRRPKVTKRFDTNHIPARVSEILNQRTRLAKNKGGKIRTIPGKIIGGTNIDLAITDIFMEGDTVKFKVKNVGFATIPENSLILYSMKTTYLFGYTRTYEGWPSLTVPRTPGSVITAGIINLFFPPSSVEISFQLATKTTPRQLIIETNPETNNRRTETWNQLSSGAGPANAAELFIQKASWHFVSGAQPPDPPYYALIKVRNMGQTTARGVLVSTHITAIDSTNRTFDYIEGPNAPTLLGAKSFGDLAPGQSKELRVPFYNFRNFDLNSVPSWMITAFVDPLNDVPERIESNNWQVILIK